MKERILFCTKIEFEHFFSGVLKPFSKRTNVKHKCLGFLSDKGAKLSAFLFITEIASVVFEPIIKKLFDVDEQINKKWLVVR